ncbi:hypothetical protein AZG88_36190 [Rhodococcus sp. LB1]|nr:hypothetical protein AZG88_36190 [Rhodococcus sp. LB1]
MVHAIAPLPASELPTSKCDFDAFRRYLHDPVTPLSRCGPERQEGEQLAAILGCAGRSKYLRTRDGAVAIEDAVAKISGVRAVHDYPRTASVVVW